MEKPPIVYEDFARVDIRIGRIVTVRPFDRARNPSYKIEVRSAGWSLASSTCLRATLPAFGPRC